MTKRELLKLEKVEERIRSGQIKDQKIYRFIMELNSYSAERLDRIAMDDGSRRYTYRQMFRNWEYYAEVFSALGMTGEKGARVGILPGTCAESILSIYALNMTGASVSMIPIFSGLPNPDKLKALIMEEKITDLIITDCSGITPFTPAELFPLLLDRAVKKLKDAGLRNLIVIFSDVTGSEKGSCHALKKQLIHDQVRRIKGIRIMEDLLEEYEASPLVYGGRESENDAIILHTSGTTKGISKPVSLSDQAFNAGAHHFLCHPPVQDLRENAVTILVIEPTTAYLAVDGVHLPFAFGGKLVLLPGGARNPDFFKIFNFHKVSVLFSNTLLMDIMIKYAERNDLDLSSMKLMAMGGAYLSADNRRKYNQFIKDHGARIRIMNGYGLCETGGAAILSPGEREDDSIGYPLPGITVKIYDEDEKRYFAPEDGPRTGGLFITADSLSSGCIDDRQYFEYEMIDGLPYLCTNDLVSVGEDGILTCLGRMNRFFVNSEGRRFEAGLVENSLMSCPGIKNCVVVPEYSKTMHDTVPVLFFTADKADSSMKKKIREALLDVYTKNEQLTGMSLPEMVVIAEDVPYNVSGKIDVYEITKGNVEGDRYRVKPVYRKRILSDILLEKGSKDTFLNIGRLVGNRRD